ncbi:hypothetical protein RRG08_014630 [Elysia crispata]|uniref:Uncharacterized protein n=1 Tax=Elysia crispata TaxID=231223 RepID=A0AAE0YTE5_9GAST|nr:hypothetical protein RRG08_014630 [Elysia crispata]
MTTGHEWSSGHCARIGHATDSLTTVISPCSTRLTRIGQGVPTELTISKTGERHESVIIAPHELPFLAGLVFSLLLLVLSTLITLGSID